MMQITKLMGSYYLTKTSIYLVCLSSKSNNYILVKNYANI